MPGARSGAAFRGLTGEMPGRLPAPGGACPLLTLDLAPGPAALQFAAALPGKRKRRGNAARAACRLNRQAAPWLLARWALRAQHEADLALGVYLRVENLVVEVRGRLRVKEHPRPRGLDNLIIDTGFGGRGEFERARGRLTARLR